MPDKKAKPSKPAAKNKPSPLVEGRDYYLEKGLFVLTEHYLLKRGYCCESGCRHCPYGFRRDKET